MRTKVYRTEHFGFDGRGESLLRWICDADILFPEPEVTDPFGPIEGSIEGAQYYGGWVLFYGLQVIEIVPEEVHSYWHRDFVHGNPKETGIWEIEESDWIKTFNPLHLANHKHFVLEFYDDIVEVICRDLIFGEGTFSLDTVLATDNRLRYAYWRRAEIARKSGNLDEAVQYYQKYIDSCPDSSSADLAQRAINHIRTGGSEG